MSNTIIAGLLIAGSNLVGMVLYAWLNRCRKPRRVTLAIIGRAAKIAYENLIVYGGRQESIEQMLALRNEATSQDPFATAAFDAALEQVLKEDAE